MKKMLYRTMAGIQQNWQLLVLVAAVALFVLAAGAPRW